MSSKPAIVINGRFLTQRVTGVQRFAIETMKAMDGLLETPGYAHLRDQITIVTPRRAVTPLALRNVRLRRAGRSRGYAWEQLELPFLAGGAALINLCALGPLLYRRQMTVIHDTTFLAVPDTFSPLTRTLYRLLVPALARRSKMVMAVSQFTRDEMAARMGIDPAPVMVCGEGGDHILARPADAGVLDRLGLGRQRFFLAVGVGGPNKNLPALLQAFAANRSPDLALVISGRRNPHIHPESSQKGDGVIYAGYISDPELRALYESAIALVYPSLYEGFGLPPLEAMACGCPVIGSDQPALVEIAGGAALHAPMRDAAALGRMMQQVASDAALRASLAERGRARAAHFSWVHTARIILDEAAKL